ncbi:wobble nucleotide-excising tRNase [Rhizobium subbaraonis]|uniref:Wobble nucleotide-excising tRNase n=1 Tax=Rhizobium subbaraonis TaxID=908946 RepID=A0A285UDW3_9HYPH|nr:AAA family ATPase [Rhizobium subbaraonis]SOC40022.1 wobble nucleotide-excising tRNase [Rhizobium subbaraonis]
MLEQIDIHGVATYVGPQQTLVGLRPVNFIYGANGSGKTTISRVIASPANYQSCSVRWAQNLALECLVYNRDFVADNFTSRMRGIFTLGQQDAAIIARIENARHEAATLQDDINRRRAVLETKNTELDELNNSFREEGWKTKLKHENVFKEAFQGVLNSKEKFAERLIKEDSENQAELKDLAELSERATTLFGPTKAHATLLQAPDGSRLVEIEAAPILAKRIVGKEDVDIGPLIKKLRNSDWVKAGLQYFHDDRCPFCQQDTDHAFREKIDEYFDEQYQAEIDVISGLIERYTALSDAALTHVEALISSGSDHLDIPLISRLHDTLQSSLSHNAQHLERKRKEPSAAVTLEPVATILKEIEDAVDAANIDVRRHNDLVDNLATERAALVMDVWRYILEENCLLLATYRGQRQNLVSAQQGLSQSIEAKTAEQRTKVTELRELEKSVTSVQPTVTAINQLLTSFGFRNFRLATAGENEVFYKIIRSDGSDAGETLSEGEKTFVTFLYFYHRISGSMSESGTRSNRIIVFDDPVSSLDSDILFVVSNLIRRVIVRACDPTSTIKQVFVLTHNIYFHKEVTFDPQRTGERRAFETFWVVRKGTGHSELVSHATNPVKTTYELLWQEVRDENRSNLTIQNTLRRILENYFHILGNVDKDDIVQLFEGEDQQVCNSLFSWINDGSHSAHDDLYLVCDDQTASRYLRVFKEVFEKANHGGHYEMMIRPR